MNIISESDDVTNLIVCSIKQDSYGQDGMEV